MLILTLNNQKLQINFLNLILNKIQIESTSNVKNLMLLLFKTE